MIHLHSLIWRPQKSERNNNKMEFGTSIAMNSILKEINNGCKKNLVLSPLSIHIVLNMLASGSPGQTLEQLLHFLQSDDISHLNAQSSILMELASSDTSIHQNPSSGWGPFGFPFWNLFSPNRSCEGPMICLVNGIWVDKHFPLKHSFKQLVEDVYKANAQSVDFLNQREHVRNEINSWAREASKGHIDPLLSAPISNDAILVLANALYFKGTWVDTFNTSNAVHENFYLLNGETVRVRFMKQYNTSNFYESFEGFKLLKMPYEIGQLDSKRYAMYIFLPDKYRGLQELVEKFNSDPRFFLENRELQEVKINQLWLPKLKYEYELNALGSMRELGLDLPFDDKKAEIKEMVETSEVVYVSNAIQKSYIEVNKEGTTAVAVTAFGPVIGCSMGHSMPVQLNFIADHLFLFMIKEEVSGIVLFVGASLNPLS